MAIRHNELQPLLDHEPSFATSAEPNPSMNNLQRDHLSPASNNPSKEFSTLPETATFGRNLTWTSTYMLTVSRIIGSGIFATPGISYRSVGRDGLAVKVWIVGALIAGCGLAVTLEFGCMLPRCGGTKIYLEPMYRYPQFFASTLVAIQAVVFRITASNCTVLGEYVLVALDMDVKATAVAQLNVTVGPLTAVTILLLFTVRHLVAEEVQTGIEEAIQGMESGYLVESCSKCLSSCGAVDSAEERKK